MTIDRISGWCSRCSACAKTLAPNKRARVRVALLAIAAILGVLTVAKATGFFIASARAERIVRQAIISSAPESKALESQAAKSKLLAEDLKKQNIFCPSAPRENPIKAVLGIFGNEAYIDGQWYKVGARIADAKIVAIGADSVTTEWDGKKTVFRPIEAEVPAPPGGPPPGSPPSGPQRPPPRPGPPGAERPDMAAAPPEPPPMHGPEGPRPPMPGEPQLSEEDRAKMREEMEKVRQ
jgi:hypothetical protein